MSSQIRTPHALPPQKEPLKYTLLTIFCKLVFKLILYISFFQLREAAQQICLPSSP